MFNSVGMALQIVMETTPNFQENTVYILDLRRQFFVQSQMTRTYGGPWLRKHKLYWKIIVENKAVLRSTGCILFFVQLIVPEQESNIQIPHQKTESENHSAINFQFQRRTSGPCGH